MLAPFTTPALTRGMQRDFGRRCARDSWWAVIEARTGTSRAR
jgi:hypothetical protein